MTWKLDADGKMVFINDGYGYKNNPEKGNIANPEIIKYLINQDSFKNEISDIKFSTKTLKYIFGEEKLNEEKFKDFVINSINSFLFAYFNNGLCSGNS